MPFSPNIDWLKAMLSRFFQINQSGSPTTPAPWTPLKWRWRSITGVVSSGPKKGQTVALVSGSEVPGYGGPYNELTVRNSVLKWVPPTDYSYKFGGGNPWDPDNTAYKITSKYQHSNLTIDRYGRIYMGTNQALSGGYPAGTSWQWDRLWTNAQRHAHGDYLSQWVNIEGGDVSVTEDENGRGGIIQCARNQQYIFKDSTTGGLIQFKKGRGNHFDNLSHTTLQTGDYVGSITYDAAYTPQGRKMTHTNNSWTGSYRQTDREVGRFDLHMPNKFGGTVDYSHLSMTEYENWQAPSEFLFTIASASNVGWNGATYPDAGWDDGTWDERMADVPVLWLNQDGVQMYTPTHPPSGSTPGDRVMAQTSSTFFLDEVANELKVAVRKSNGDYLTGTVASLSPWT
tara:strand:+ start:26075 stop:27271 length:1197 start_codon:yes stop_codon:yes gene_type:complete